MKYFATKVMYSTLIGDIQKYEIEPYYLIVGRLIILAQNLKFQLMLRFSQIFNQP